MIKIIDMTIICIGIAAIILNSHATDVAVLSPREQLISSRKGSYESMRKTLEEEGIDLGTSYLAMKEDFLEKYQNINKNSINTIPLIQHFVYVFGKERPRTIPDNKLIKMIRLIEKLNQDDSSWKHYIWTNDATGIPSSLSRLHNVHIKFLNELEGSVLYDDIILRSNSYQIFDLSQLSDLMRITVLQKYGGVYFDCDGTVFRPEDLKKFMNNFDLVLGEAPDSHSIPGAIMASSSNHLFLDIATYLMYRNIHQDDFRNIPEYLKYNYNDHENVIVETGPIVITVAYYKYANLMRQNGVKTKSIVLPPLAFYNLQLARKEPPTEDGCGLLFGGVDFEDIDDIANYRGIKINSIASDPGCGEWRWAK